MKIYFASGNAHKKQELEHILKTALTIPKDEGIDFNPEETGSTFFDNAYIKARALWNIVQQPVIADDSGICVDALHGEPGIFSARFGSTDGITLTAAERNDLLLKKVGDASSRACHYVCCMILMISPDVFYSVQESFYGELTRTPNGTGGFGYDPIVFIPQLHKTVAELTAQQKNKYSHRAKAGRGIRIFLKNIKNR